MAIYLAENAMRFTLSTQHTSYQIYVDDDGFLRHTYYGQAIGRAPMEYTQFQQEFGFSPCPESHERQRDLSVDLLCQEYTGCDTGDFRISAIALTNADGSHTSQFLYQRHQIHPGKYAIAGLPSAWGKDTDCQTLEIVLADTVTGLELHLFYGVFPEMDVITRCALLKNTSNATIVLTKAASACLDIPFGDWELIHFHGRHSMERMTQRVPVSNIVQVIQSRRGFSSHQHNPFAILAAPETTELCGSCYGAMLVYSGSYKIEVERDQQQMTRMVLGLQDENFSWILSPGETFATPEVLFSYSADGLGQLSRQYHSFLRNHICRGKFAHIRRPVLINNWEATYMRFNGEKIYQIAKQASALGVEMLVLDDGWFGNRNSDHTGLGDWYANEQKLGGSLNELARRIHDLGMKFGLWFEPEMISVDSDLYRAHPEWVLQVPGRSPAFSRSQLVLDLSRTPVQDYLYTSIAKILRNCPIEYVKWDANRHLTDAFSSELPPHRQGEVHHRYILGLYALLERLTSDFPDVLFEGCSGGGGRFDAGMLCYCPQIWCSDNTDPIARLQIQYGTSFGYPVCAVGSHVSASPNHQTNRSTPMQTRSVVAMSGSFGYELDIARLSEEERKWIPREIENYKRFWPLISHGNYYRLTNAMTDRFFTAWQYSSPDGTEALLNLVVLSPQATPCAMHVCLRGLDPDRMYRLEGTCSQFSGAALMYGGYTFPRMYGDYPSAQLHFIATEGSGD